MSMDDRDREARIWESGQDARRALIEAKDTRHDLANLTDRVAALETAYAELIEMVDRLADVLADHTERGR